MQQQEVNHQAASSPSATGEDEAKLCKEKKIHVRKNKQNRTIEFLIAYKKSHQADFSIGFEHLSSKTRLGRI